MGKDISVDYDHCNFYWDIPFVQKKHQVYLLDDNTLSDKGLSSACFDRLWGSKTSHVHVIDVEDAYFAQSSFDLPYFYEMEKQNESTDRYGHDFGQLLQFIRYLELCWELPPVY